MYKDKMVKKKFHLSFVAKGEQGGEGREAGCSGFSLSAFLSPTCHSHTHTSLLHDYC